MELARASGNAEPNSAMSAAASAWMLPFSCSRSSHRAVAPKSLHALEILSHRAVASRMMTG